MKADVFCSISCERAGVPVLTGHHRNYSKIMAKAREIVQSGRLGRIVARQLRYGSRRGPGIP